MAEPLLILALSAALIALPFMVAAYLRARTLRLRGAHDAWVLLQRHARILLEDRALPPEVGDLVARIVDQVGTGAMTRYMLWGLLSRPTRSELRASPYGRLNDEHRRVVFRFMLDALLFDSLNTLVHGILLRRVLYWLGPTVQDERAPVSNEQAVPVVRAAGRAIGAPRELIAA